MNEERFLKFLKRGGRSPSARKRVIRYLEEFEQYLRTHCEGKGLDEARPQDLETFTSWIEEKHSISAKLHLWAIRYYYEYTSNETMRRHAGELREQRIKRAPFKLAKFWGVDSKYVKKLAAIGIKDVEQMLRAGHTPRAREDLAAKTGIPLDVILEFVKLSDLARIPGVKAIRARLYYDAGVDTIEKLAKWDPEELRLMLIEFVEQTGFDGIAPLSKEAQFTVATARTLPKIVEY